MIKVVRAYILDSHGKRCGVTGREIQSEWLEKHGEEKLKEILLKRGYEFKEWFI